MEKQEVIIFVNRDNLLESAIKSLLEDKKLKIVYLINGSDDFDMINNDLDYDYYKINIEDLNNVECFIKDNYHGEEIFFLGMYSDFANTRIDYNSIVDFKKNGIHIFWKIIKSLHSDYLQKKIQINVITNGMFKVLHDEDNYPMYSAIQGFVRSVINEYGNWQIKALDVEITDDVSRLIKDLNVGLTFSNEWIAVRNGICYKQDLCPVKINQNDNISWRKNGTYFILGGHSGIGLALSEYIIKNYNANVIIAGRREINDDIKNKLDSLRQLGGKVDYISGDCTSISDMKKCLIFIKSKYDKLDGVIHSAIVLKDSRIINMTLDDLDNVLAPKLEGMYSFYEAFKDEPLDFMLFFSSMQAFIGSQGQANYAGASSFEDSFAEYIRSNSKFKVKVINWGVWGETGIVAKESYLTMLSNQGVIPISTVNGMQIIEDVLKNPYNQVLVIDLTSEAQNALNMNRSKYYLQLEDDKNISVIENVVNSINKELKTTDDFDKIIEGLKIIDLYGIMRLGIILSELGMYDTYKSFEEWMTYLNIDEKYQRLFELILDLLQENDTVFLENNKYKLNLRNLASSSDIKDCIRKITESYSETIPHLNLLNVCLDNYKKILTGEVNAVDILFPDGDMSLVEPIYHGNRSSDYFNDLVARIICECVIQKGKCCKTIKIVEIGAGTGGTSNIVLEELSKLGISVEYYYTDISLGFVKYGKKRFSEKYPFAKFCVLDIEKDVEFQELGIGQFDLVFGSNVLHATKDIINTMQNAKRLLKKNGIIVINEMTYPEIFTSLTFGLTDGWWLYDDIKVRIPNSPLLSVESWKNTLDILGYMNTRIFSFKNLKEEEYVQSIILSESNGVVLLNDNAKDIEPNDIKQFPNYEEKRIAPPKKANRLYNLNLSKDIVIEYIKNVFENVLHVKRSVLKNDVTFEKIGVDSLIVLEINKQFMKEIGKIPSTILFEYNTIDKLADYFMEEKTNELNMILLDNTEQTSFEENDNKPIFKFDASEKNELFNNTDDKEDIFDIAIIGLAGKYPESDTLDDLWEHLKNGDDLVKDVPVERWNMEKFYSSSQNDNNKIYTTKGCFIDDIDKFDPLFFSITPKEAQFMDPQERISLENVWSLFEDAGMTRSSISKSDNCVGVFWGVMNNDYVQCGGKTSYWSMANRISYIMNFTGPSLAIDTACSSSLTAIHLACQSIRNGECSMAVAGGVNLILSPEHYINLCNMGMLSAKGKCSPFGIDADGFVDGEGVGSVLLKPLDMAIKDNNHIYGVIKSSSMNSGGKTSGYTVPNPNEQAKLIRKAIENGNIDPENISYVEAHGTGTVLGDPIEIRGLQKAFQIKGNEKKCSIGSIKSNIGHLESASGIAGVTKVLLQMKYGMLVPSIHSDELNPQIDLENTPFYIQHKLEPWDRKTVYNKDGKKECNRMACISSFGAGGANAHVIIEEYIDNKENKRDDSEHIFVLSADDKTQLREYVHKMKKYLMANIDNLNPNDIEYTLIKGREMRKEIIAFKYVTISDIINYLSEYIIGKYDEKNNIEFSDQSVNNMSLSGRAVSLPTYPFRKDRCWVEKINIEGLFENLASGEISVDEIDSLISSLLE